VSEARRGALERARGWVPPIVQAIRALERRPDRGATALYLACALVAGLVLLVPLSARLTRELAKVHHFRPSSLPAWVGLQVVPKMYSFANTCWIGPYPILDPAAGDDGEARFARESFWVNHYPARRLRFDAGRASLGLVPRFAYVRSSYRGRVETTAFTVQREPQRLVLRVRGEQR
jgi:hypothetical protein